MIEELPDTSLFRRVRIPLIDFMESLTPQTGKDGIKKPAATQHPSIHFRCQHGFYLATSFFDRFYSHLLPRPQEPSVSHLFVWTLRKDCVWAAAMQNFEGKNQPVPWWAQRPFLAYAAKMERQLVTSDHPIVFFMEAKVSKSESFKEPVSLSLHYGIRSEWRWDLLVPEGKHPCYEGQTFLSVA